MKTVEPLKRKPNRDRIGRQSDHEIGSYRTTKLAMPPIAPPEQRTDPLARGFCVYEAGAAGGSLDRPALS